MKEQDKTGEKAIEDFIKRCFYIIIPSRVHFNENLFSQKDTKFLTKFCIKEPNIEEIFSGEYDEIEEFGNINEKSYILDIYFKRKEIKLLIEKWTFKYSYE